MSCYYTIGARLYFILLEFVQMVQKARTGLAHQRFYITSIQGATPGQHIYSIYNSKEYTITYDILILYTI
jgi:hypothetical protein